jgi:hypothetical protein
MKQIIKKMIVLVCAPLVGQDYRTNLEHYNHRDEWTAIIKANGMTHPASLKFGKAIVHH